MVIALTAAGIFGWRIHRGHTVAGAPTFVDEGQCASCHSSEKAALAPSHHALAMQEATTSTVRGDFSNRIFNSNGIQARFFRRDGRFFVNTKGPDGHPADFEVKYTFGVEPLQQYLLEFPRGRYQAFTIAWDVGHQQWFDLKSHEHGDDLESLHWSQPANNWNFMCAECHSTDVKKNYDPTSDSYNTRFSQINVGCQACHGPASEHLALVRDGRTKPADSSWGFAVDPMRRGAIAQVDACGRCHSRRAALVRDYSYGKPLLDTHLPALLTEGLYFADGQIQDEVYEYGSFLQSKMYSKGVRCSDCHDPHSLKTRAPGNSLCTSCHSTAEPVARHPINTETLKHKNYDSPEHHFHQPGSPGAQCVNCHMAPRTYMELQIRHDHSLRIPRPDLSGALGTPNACTNCHRDKAAAWAAKAVAAWYGPGRRKEATYGEILWAGRRRDPGSAGQLVDLASDRSQAGIVRSTAIELLRSYPPGPKVVDLFRAGLNEEDPLVRRAATAAYELVEPEERNAPLAHALKDPLFAVRTEAARLLAGVPRTRLSAGEAADLGNAVAEYVAVQQENADRPESYLNLGNLYASQGDIGAAEAAYEDALLRDRTFVPAYVNLADTKSNNDDLIGAEAELRVGMRVLPDSASLHHLLGLLLIGENRRADGLAELKRATELDPDVARFAYVFGVACHDLKTPSAGVSVLRAALQRFPNDRELLLGLAGYALESGDAAAANRYSERLKAIEEVHSH